MGSQWGRDRNYVRAMREGYRSRAAYKLREIQDRHHIIRETDNIVDLGAAPGSWLQVAKELTKGKIVGVDLSPISPLEGVTTLVGDFSNKETRDRVLSILEPVSIVLSDASPKLSGHRSYDQARAIGLGEDSLLFACNVLKKGGNFVVKSFQGEDFHILLREIRKYFLSVKTFKCKASRKGSSEIYVIAKNFIGCQYDAEGSI
ncbi:MAG TPA: RlmE family RNA methyltransferase [Methanoregulaceae archaeon]|nr:RlmE family RNA methyltransferase [Methanoregulaceae archaeon]